MSSAVLWLAGMAGLPALVAVGSRFRMELERLRRLSVAAAGATLLAALVPAFSTHLREFVWRAHGGAVLLRVNAFASAMLPFAAGLWLLTVAVTPRSALDRGGLARAALATLTTLGSFLTENALILLVLQAAAVWIFLAALRDPAHRYQRRIVAGYLGASTLLLGAGVAMLLWTGSHGATTEAMGIWLVAIAALLRKGIVPFHAWVPEVFDHGRLGPAILFSAPQVGAYITLVLIVPRASPGLLRMIALLALVTAVYGAALALVQPSARRACGYLFMSQSALVMAGLGCTSSTALAGGLVLWVSAGLAFAGLARAILVLEARRGRLDLTQYHGGYDRTPVLAVSFLALGLACAGFPGTLGFVGQELLVNGAVAMFPVMGFTVVAATALTGVAVLRMYFSLFCGRPEARFHSSLRFEIRRREAAAFAALVAVLIGLGVAPGLLVASRIRVSHSILQLRAARPMVGTRGGEASRRVDYRGLPMTGGGTKMALWLIHRGEHLAKEIQELGMSGAGLARKLDVPTARVTGNLSASGPLEAIPRCAWRTSSAQARSFGSTSRAFMKFGLPRKRPAGPFGCPRL